MATRERCSNLSLNGTAREREKATAGMFGGEMGASVQRLLHMLTFMGDRVPGLV